MKVALEISSSLYERAQQAMVTHRYESLAQLASVAIENQLLLEAGQKPSEGSDGNKTLPNEDRQESPNSNVTGFELLSLRVIPEGTPIPTLDTTDAARLDVSENGWLWGIVNRVLPIKIAAR